MANISTSDFSSELSYSSYFTQEIHILLMLLYVIITVINFGANTLIWIVILRNSVLQSPMNYLLLNMSLADMIAGLSVYPFVFKLDVRTVFQAPSLQSHLCILTELSFFFVASGVSLFVLCAISCNRFLGICYPTRQHLRMGRLSVIAFSMATWVMSTSCVLPCMFSLKYEPKFKSCVFNWGPINAVAYRVSILMIGTMLPTLFLILSFLAILMKSREAVPMDDDRMRSRRILKMRKAERMLGALIVVYLVCWLPFSLYWGLYSFTDYFPMTVQGVGRSSRWLDVTVFFAALNGTLNPFVYSLGSSDFKRAVIRLLRHCWIKVTCHRDARVKAAPKTKKSISQTLEEVVSMELSIPPTLPEDR